MKIEINDSLCERGGTLLVTEDGSMVAWLPVGDKFLEVTYNPDNYPALNVVPTDLTEAQIVKHINDNLVGWYVRKCNLEGVRVGKADDVIVADGE